MIYVETLNVSSDQVDNCVWFGKSFCKYLAERSTFFHGISSTMVRKLKRYIFGKQ